MMALEVFYTPDRLSSLGKLFSLPELNWVHCGINTGIYPPRFVGKHKCHWGCRVLSRVPGTCPVQCRHHEEKIAVNQCDQRQLYRKKKWQRQAGVSKNQEER